MVNCKGDSCPWRLCAARIKNSRLCQIRTFTDEHTCHRLNKSKNKQANADYIANHIPKKLRESPNIARSTSRQTSSVSWAPKSHTLLPCEPEIAPCASST